MSLQWNTESLEGESDPTELGVNLEGNSSLGQHWAVDAAPDGLLIGTSEADQVVWAPLSNFPQSGSLSPGLAGRILAEDDGDRFGTAVVRLDDFDQSGTPELMVGAPDKQGGGGRIGAGAAYLFSDLGDGFEQDQLSETALVRILGDEAGDHFGKVIRMCGDVDGDGLSDILIAAPDNASQASRAGRVYLLYSSLLPDLPTQILAASIPVQLTSTKAGAQLGRDMDCSSDFTGDGIADLLLSAPFEDSSQHEAAGAVHLIPGGPQLASNSVADAALWSLRGNEDDAYFGSSIATGDFDGDALPDLLVGVPGASQGDGGAYFFSGESLAQGDIEPWIHIESDLEGARLGVRVGLLERSVSGRPSLFIGAPRANPDGRNSTFYSGVLYGFSPEILTSTVPVTGPASKADYTWHTPQGYRRMGAQFILRDLDNDEAEDLILLLGND